MKLIIETPRLILREFILSDAEKMYDLNKDPEVLQYTGDLPFNSIQEARNFLEHYSDYERNGFGRWAVVRKDDSEFIGWCGLKLNEENLIDLGFRFFQKFWNRGYATESAKACLEYGFSVLHLNEVVGRAMKENTGSIRVLEKLGMEFWKEQEVEGLHNAVYYRIHKN